jgi:hypothetical protein
MVSFLETFFWYSGIPERRFHSRSDKKVYLKNPYPFELPEVQSWKQCILQKIIKTALLGCGLLIKTLIA